MRFRIDSIFSSFLLIASFGTVFASIPDPDVPAYERERAVEAREAEVLQTEAVVDEQASVSDQTTERQDADEISVQDDVR